jgi:RNA polymerase sigma-70 factor (ECF subfamily)
MREASDERGETPPFESDRRLTREAQNGSSQATDELLDRLKQIPRILRAQNTHFGNVIKRHDLDDLAQDVFIVIWRKLESYDGRRSFEAWAYGVCRFELLNTIRRQVRNEMSEFHHDLPDRSRAPGLDFEEVHRGLDTLPPEEFSVVHLKHFDGLTFDEVGLRLTIPSNTAKTRYYRGMKKLQEYLRERRAALSPRAAEGKEGQ